MSQESLTRGSQQYTAELEQAIALIVATHAVVVQDGGLPSTPEVDELSQHPALK